MTKKPKNHIVRIGTKVAESSTVKVVERKLPFDTEYIYDEKLEAGKEVVESEGKVGKEKVTITTKITDGTGEVSEATETITEKEDRKVRVGIKPVVKTEEIPHDTTYKHNPELKAGETKEIQPGTPGKVTITTTFNKETGKLETKVERTEPTNAKYEYGSKTTGEVKVKSEIPFEVEIIEDPTMDAGTHKITQEGEKGEKETTIVIENSVEKSRTDKTTKEAVKKIIRVGTKPNENMCPVPGMPNNPDPIPDSPELPEEDEPKVPDSPNKTPEKPEKPGENKPNESGTPTETPENPTNTDKENPNTQEGSKEDPKKGEEKLEEKEDNRENVSDELSKKRKDRGDLASRKSTNPKTGVGSVAPILTSMGLSIAGLLATKKKKKEDE